MPQPCSADLGAILPQPQSVPLARNKGRLQRDCKAPCEDVLKESGRLQPEKDFQEKCNNDDDGDDDEQPPLP